MTETRSDPAPHDPTFVKALEGIEIWFQPVHDTAGAVVAHEALVRPRHPLLSDPAKLIQAARTVEQKWQLDRAVRTAVADLVGRGWPAGDVFVNLLPESLGDPQLIGGEDPLEGHADRVVLEISERAPLSDIGGFTQSLRAARDRGFRIALDDLGAGGRESVTDLEPDVVKFDMELVRGIDEVERSATLVASLVEVCRELEITTVAEGIESTGELRTVQSLGVDLFQGYLLGKPAPPPVA